MIRTPDRVELRFEPETWPAFPDDEREHLIAATERVRRIRADLAWRSPIDDPAMMFPVVHVVPFCVITSLARACFLVHAGCLERGVEIFAPTAIHADDETMQVVMMHEFTHVFRWWRHEVNRTMPAADTPDHERHDPPELWFGAEDVALYRRRNAEHAFHDEALARAMREWHQRGLPTRADYPPGGFDQFRVPQAVHDLIRETPLPR